MDFLDVRSLFYLLIKINKPFFSRWDVRNRRAHVRRPQDHLVTFSLIQGPSADSMKPTGLSVGDPQSARDHSSSSTPDLLKSDLANARDAPAGVVIVSNHASSHHTPQYPATALAHAQAHVSAVGASGMAAGDQHVFDKLFVAGKDEEHQEPPAKPAGAEEKEDEKPKLPPVPLTQLWRFSSKGDKILLLFGCFCGALPLLPMLLDAPCAAPG